MVQLTFHFSQPALLSSKIPILGTQRLVSILQLLSSQISLRLSQLTVYTMDYIMNHTRQRWGGDGIANHDIVRKRTKKTVADFGSLKGRGMKPPPAIISSCIELMGSIYSSLLAPLAMSQPWLHSPQIFRRRITEKVMYLMICDFDLISGSQYIKHFHIRFQKKKVHVCTYSTNEILLRSVA